MQQNNPQPTLSTINDFSRQQIIEFIADKLIRQNERSVSYMRGGCRYRGDNNMRCAIGWLISDEEYNPNMESSTVKSLYFKRYEINYNTLAMLAELQDMHDCNPIFAWPTIIEGIAKKYGLDTVAIRAVIQKAQTERENQNVG